MSKRKLRVERAVPSIEDDGILIHLSRKITKLEFAGIVAAIEKAVADG